MLLSSKYRTPKLSKTLEMGQLYKDLTKKGHKITNLGLGQSPFSVPTLLQESLKRNSHKADYLPVEGLPELREALSHYYHRPLDNILITPGSKMAYFMLQTVLENTFIIPQPSWVSYADQAHLLNRQPILLQTSQSTNWKVTPQLLTTAIPQNKLKNSFLILNNPNNPTGATYSPSELKQLANVAKTYNITVIADEVYWMLNHSSSHSQQPTSIADYLPDQTIFVSSISKYLSAGGWRLGYIILPPNNPTSPKLFNALKSVASNTYSCVPAPIQYATTIAYRDLALSPKKSLIQQEISKINSILAEIAHNCHKIITTIAPKNIITSPSQGAYYLYLTFPNLANPSSTDPARELLTKHNILTISGTAFGTPKNTIRVSFTSFEGDKLIILKNRQTNKANDLINADSKRRILQKTYKAFETIAHWANENSTISN